MTNRSHLYQTVEDVRTVAKHREFVPVEGDIDCRVSANVGDLMAVAMAAAGGYAIRLGGRTACETDYLAASGATFPEIPLAELVRFNERTLVADMDEAAEHRRYAEIGILIKKWSA